MVRNVYDTILARKKPLKKKKNYEFIKSIFSRKLAKFASLKYHLSQNKKRKYESRSSNFEGTSFWYRGDRFTV